MNIRKFKQVILLSTIIIATISCKETLTLAPLDSFGDQNFWKNEAQVSGFMQGLHTQFRDDQFQFIRLGELRGGSLSTVEIFPVSLNEVPLIEQKLDENTSGTSNWAGFYGTILQLNLFIQKVETSDFLATTKKSYYLGQAYAMRAYYYFHLLRTYGGVPLRLEPEIVNGTTDPVALRKERATEAEVMAAIKADINKSITSFGTATLTNKGQWNPMAALMLKGEIYLWSAKVYGVTTDLAEAKSALNAVSGFSLLPNFSDVFAYGKKKNSEIILTMSFLASEAEMSNVATFTYDLPGLAGGFYADSLATGPIISTSPDPLNIGQPNSKQIIQRYRYSFDLFKSYNKADKRKLATFYDFYKVDKTKTPYLILARNTVLRKFLGTFEQNKRYFSDDWPVYREADRLLMLAEIVNAEGGDPSSYIKLIRDRAFGGVGLDPTPFVNSNKDANELAIFAERSKEFVHEGKRWYDLRRMKFGSEPLVFISPSHPYGVLNKSTFAYKTLWQLFVQKNNSFYVPGCKILDWPAFGLRGFMHDTGRNFQDISSLKLQIDRLASYKYNTFHWHLTDNPAWRPQSKIYPQLNDIKNRKPGRDPEKSYSFDNIRELISYAKQRNIIIIPELDMPGHSAYFKPTFGFKMETEEGMQVLEKLIDEFCTEIPAADCPIIHLGSDEVHIPNPKEFIKRMTDRLKLNGRKAMVWNPGLKGEKSTIEQLWFDDGAKNAQRTGNPYVDSYGGYLNSADALSLIQRYFFQQICNRPQGDSIALGGILCCWPDTRVDDKNKILLHSPVWPGALTYSEALWCGRPQYVKDYMTVLPAANTEAWKYFHEFEQRLASHRDQFFKKEPFPFVQFSRINWQMTNPYIRTKEQPVDKAFYPEKNFKVFSSDSVKSKLVSGGVLRFGTLIQPTLLSPDATETIYISTSIFSKQKKQIHAWIGFETPVRSNRRSAGIPATGKWDANGGTVWVNNKELDAPLWQQPGANHYLYPTWETPANEIPYTDEEFYWSRDPAAIQLEKGWNNILMRVPRTYKDQIWTWMSAFIPVKLDSNGRWVEDLSILFKSK